MPLFSVDGGRPVATSPVRPAEMAYGATVVDEHLGALLGEHLLPVRVRSGGEDEPYLLAVDVLGRPVVVEVVGVLDGASLLRALAHLGRAARLSLRDLATRYRGGSQRFTTDLATFRESVPAAQLVPDGRGARLLLVCAQVGPGLADVVEALTDRGIEVLRVGLVEGPNGRLVDVSPVRATAPDGSWTVSGGVAMLTDGVRDLPGVGVPPDEDTVSRMPAIGDGLVTRVPSGSHGAERYSAASVGPATRPEEARRAPAWTPVAGYATGSASGGPNGSTRLPVRGHSAGHRSQPITQPGSTAPSGSAPVARTKGGDPRLAALAAHGPLVLVWHRQRRGQTYRALVRTDGLIELADGTRVVDPSAAAEVVSGAQAPIDGWRVWRVGGDAGPTLGEACRG
jgi:hypothetical protein